VTERTRSDARGQARSDAAGGADDVVALLMRQHGDIRNLFDEVERTDGDGRREAFHRLVRLLAIHETAEEEVVHPAARRAFDGGEQVIAERLEEERQAKETLRRLDGMDTEDPGFMPLLLTLRTEVTEHARAEERYEFIQLRRRTGTKRLAMMARAVKAAEAMAPTHPHPGTESAAKNLALGPLAAVMDRTRDTVRKAMGGRG
jgi:hemerythrin superfamily protein